MRQLDSFSYEKRITDRDERKRALKESSFRLRRAPSIFDERIESARGKRASSQGRCAPAKWAAMGPRKRIEAALSGERSS